MKSLVLTLFATGGLLPAVLSGMTNTNLFLPPYICVGRILDFQRLNAAVRDETATFAVFKPDPNDPDKPGRLLARTTLRNYADSTVNYRLEIPYALKTGETTVTAGETIIPIVTFAGKEYTTTHGLALSAVTKPGDVVETDFTLVVDENNDGIDDGYAELLQEYAKALGLTTDAIFNPDADYDRDGKSNREEYLAGTSPVSADDRFRITGFELEDDFVKLTFIVSPARSYALTAKDGLQGETEWPAKTFRERNSASDPEMKVYHMTDFEGAVEKTIYIRKPEAGVPHFFYKVLSH